MKYLKLISIIGILGLIISLFILGAKYKALDEDYKIAVGNEKALLHQNSNLNTNIGVLQLKVDQLSYFNDSILHKLDSVRRELKIKDKALQQLQYTVSKIEKKDSIVFKKDTIFQKDVHIDTLLQDKWYTLSLQLDYPNSVVVHPEFLSEQYLIIQAAKETVDPPKKFFLCRWFQKKHKVVRVDIVEENPYIKHLNTRFVKIID